MNIRWLQWLCTPFGTPGLFSVLVLINTLVTYRVVQQVRDIRDADEIHHMQWAVIRSIHERTETQRELR